MTVLPLYPLYPNPSFSEYNVSLSIPGINMWNLSGIGKCIKDLEYPNTKSLLLVPDIEYIKKFATYDLGIADMILRASLSKNLSRTRDTNLQSTFTETFNQSNLPGAGLKSLEKTIISSIFESYKPYFTIAQMATESIVDIEDIIARLSILSSPMVVSNPFGVKSRKPVGNDGNFGTPTAMGYKKGVLIKDSLNEFKRVSKKGLNIKINNNGKSKITKKGPQISIGGDTKFDYVTISSVYSTGIFKSDVNYQYQYIDIQEDPEPRKDPIEIDPEVDKRPNIIILGVFDNKGKPVNPNDEKLSWILKSPKWILNKSIDLPNAQNWKLVDNTLFHWKKFGKVLIQKDSPGVGWKKLNYGDVMDFSLRDNENSKYKKDDPVITFKASDLNDFKKYFDSKVELSLKNVKLEKDQESLVRNQIKKIYQGPSKTQPGQTLLSEHVQNLVQFSKLKKTPYQNFDKADTRKVGILNFKKDNLVFKPMRFKISNEEVWIDPETDYDYKIIQINPQNITNNPRTSNNPFSKGRYGDGTKEDPQSYGYIERKKINDLDFENFYIIEAIKKESNNTYKNSNKKEKEDGFYKLPDALGVIPILINLAVKVFSKLIPEINKLISLLKNPSQFVIDIITQKIKDPISGFSFFTDESIKILGDLPLLASKVKGGIMEVDEMIDIVRNSSLKNYIHVDRLGNWKFLLNGEGTTDFLGIIFGIKIDFMSTTPIAPIIDTKGSNIFGSNFNTKCGEDNIPTRPTQKSDINTKKLDNKNTESVNSISNSNQDDTYYEEISVKYSTGEKIEGVNYKYIYVDQEMTRLISEADELVNLEKDTSDQISSNLEEALRKYQTALEKERNKDAVDRNSPLITLLMGKINDVRQKLNIVIQPIFKIIFGLVTMPLKLVLKIINCILDFFKSLFENPATIPTKIAEFLTFNWLIKLFKPAGLLYLAGIDFSPEKLAMWSAAIAGKIELGDIPLADLKDFLFAAYQMVLPEFTEKQFKDLGDKPFRILVPTLTFFQMIINAVIMLIWSIFGISSVLSPPLMCNKYNINDADLSDLLSGLFKDKKVDDPKSSGDSYTFIYEVKLGDGTTRRLDAEELQKFIEENKDTNFDFDNFKTIE